MMVAPVSVVIPCYQCASTIARAVASVAGQTVRPTEVILVEDGSGDETFEVVQQVQQDYQPSCGETWIRVISLGRNRGPSAARNTGWDAAAQPYVAFLDADDSWHPQKIALQYGWMSRHPEVALTSHRFGMVRGGMANTSRTHPPDYRAWRVRGFHLLLSNHFITPTVMLKRALPYRFRCGQHYAEDYRLWLHLIFNGFLAYKLELKLAFLHKSNYGESGLSSHMWKIQRFEQENFATMWREGYISRPAMVFARTFSFLKFLHRIVRVAVLRPGRSSTP
jgi:glycosyltransferase involved in cell wall biosynthesis